MTIQRKSERAEPRKTNLLDLRDDGEGERSGPRRSSFGTWKKGNLATSEKGKVGAYLRYHNDGL